MTVVFGAQDAGLTMLSALTSSHDEDGKARGRTRAILMLL